MSCGFTDGMFSVTMPGQNRIHRRPASRVQIGLDDPVPLCRIAKMLEAR